VVKKLSGFELVRMTNLNGGSKNDKFVIRVYHKSMTNKP